EWLSLMVRSGTDIWTDTRLNIIAYERTRNSFGRGSYSEEVLRRQETNSDFIFTLNKDLTPDLKLTAQAGGVSRVNYYKRNYSEVQQLTIDEVYNLGNNASPNIDASAVEESQVNSLFGSFQVGYNNYLFLDVTGRNDWSSTLPASNNSFFYPSVSLSGVITEMLGIKSPVLSFGKLRASWAQVGNDADPYLLQQVFSPTGLWDGAIPKFAESKEIANSSLKPEITTGIELGADLRFLSGRIGLDLTYYNQTTRDQILGVDISRASGYTRRVLNAGEIQNKGVEIQLNGTLVEIANSLRWDLGVNFSKNRNEVVALAEGLTSLTLCSYRGDSLEARVGEPYGNLYGNKFARADDGQLLYKNGYPYNLAGQHVIGNITPDWLAGVSNTFSYKGVALSVLIDMKKGGALYDMGVSLQRVTGVLEETAVGREEGVIGAGVKNMGTEESPQYVTNDVVVPARNFYGYYSGRQYHEAAVFDGTYVKLREASLSYTLPAKWMSNNFLQSVSVSVVGRNLAILFKNTVHADPEISSASLGYSYGQLPSTRSMGFSVNVKF
ncbi:MAG: TonB-dependent receptor, partial [Imperialibacter sp.]